MTDQEQTVTEENAEKIVQQTPKLGIIEEDDEFEEFEMQDWDFKPSSGDKNPHSGLQVDQWEADWDDENLDDEFSVQLRTELLRLAAEGSVSA